MRTLESISDSWKGIHRESNKDGFHVVAARDYTLFLIFDGVSSSKNAKAGVDIAIDFCTKSHDMYYKNNDFHLSHLMEDMNICLLRQKTEGLETTCSIAYIPCGEHLPFKISHLGDSRIYGLNHSLKVYTEDHNDPILRNMLTKCLGLERLVADDFYETTIMDIPKRILLCTDGFYNVMESDPDLFLQLLTLPDLENIKHQINNVVALQNSDDATYALVIVS